MRLLLSLSLILLVIVRLPASVNDKIVKNKVPKDAMKN